MKRSTKTIIVILSALIVGLGFTFGIRMEVNKQISPKIVYYTSNEIAAGTLITEEIFKDNFFERETPNSAVPPTAVTDSNEVIGKYVKQGFSIPQYSMISKDVLVAENDMPNSSVLKLKEGEYAFPLLVDLETSLGNGILPDTKVDIAFRTTVVDEETGEEKILYGNVAENVRVTSVKDSNADAVFKDEKTSSTTSSNGKTNTMSRLYTFAVSRELEELLSSAVKLGEIRPVAKGQSKNTINVSISENEVVKFIQDQTFVDSNFKPLKENSTASAAGTVSSDSTVNKINLEGLSPEEIALIKEFNGEGE